MKSMGIQGTIRGKPHRTTIPDRSAPCPLDKVNRQFRVPVPNMLRVSDFTCVATWKGFVHVDFVIDAYARPIVGGRVSTSAHAGFVLDALEQAVHERRPAKAWDWSTAAIAGPNTSASAVPSASPRQGSNPRSAASATDTIEPWSATGPRTMARALAETINGLFKSEVIHRRGPWRNFEAVEYATPERLDWFNNRRLPEPIGNIPPAEAEANFFAALENEPMAA